MNVAEQAERDPGAWLPNHKGMNYRRVLARLHAHLAPRTYLEIGTAAGGTLALAECRTVAIDPRFRLDSNVVGAKPACMFFQTTSDAFFAEENVEALLGAKVDLAFLDGMHHFEFLLRDFFNTEAVCRPESVIVMHDCLPTDLHAARRRPSDSTWRHVTDHPNRWAGDVWKTLVILKAVRPDLRILCCSAPPTGLVIVSNLDPRSRVLRDEHDRLVAEHAPLDLRAYGLRRLHAECAIRDTRAMVEKESFFALLRGA